MTPEAAGALARLESLVSWYEKCHPGSNLSREWAAVEILRRELGKLAQVAAIYHEGIERIGGRCDVRG